MRQSCGHDPQEIYDDIVDLHEVSLSLGVPMKRVKKWVERRHRTGCPSPVRKFRHINIYSRAEWKGWYRLWQITRGTRVSRTAQTDSSGSG